jgi:D-alanyl-D-alanine carboxypeptidase (penicillin-binding protein 5/6)
VPASATTTHPPARSATTVVIPPPKAWILVDATTGAVLDQGNDRTPLPPASLTKLLTAVIAAQTLQPSDTMTVSARAAGEPARKIGMKQGEVWTFQDALYCLLLSSANDAAAAIGERIAGTLEDFAAIMAAAGAHLGLADSPVLQDPAGLDDSFSVGGGNLLSARDIAIIARAALAQPLVASVVSTDQYAFIGPDGAHHHLTNHIASFLRTYPGAIGLKPGFTSKAGNGLALAARRNGRTLISVVLDAPDTTASATALLDEGFALPAGATGTGDVLPAVHLPANALTPAAAATASQAAAVPAPPVHHGGHGGTDWLEIGAVLVLIGGPLVLAVMARRREVRRRRQRRLAARRAAMASGRVVPLRRPTASTAYEARSRHEMQH